MRSQGIKNFAQVEHLDERKQNCVPTAADDEHLREYIASLPQDGEKVFEILDEDVADLDSPDYAPDKPEEEHEPEEPKILLQSARASGEYIYDIDQATGKVTWCWHKTHAMRVNLSQVDEAMRMLAERHVETFATWA
jgi:hypothetical protein